MSSGELVQIGTGALEVASAAGSRLYEAFLAGRSANTRAAYTQDVEYFATYLGEVTGGGAIQRLLMLSHGEGNGLMLGYRSHMVEQGLAPSTVNRRLAAIRSAVKLARTLGLTDWTPEIDGLKVQAYRDTTGPGIKGTRSMLSHASHQDAAKAARDVALIRLMFDLGLRRGECVRLDLEDLDRDGGRLWIKGKGRAQKEHKTLPAPTREALERWLAIRSTVAAPSETAMFVGLSGISQGRRITGAGVYHVISALGASVGIKTRPHGLRHASITAALDANNGDVRAVQGHARHADPKTTMRYDDNRRDLAGQVAAGIADLL